MAPLRKQLNSIPRVNMISIIILTNNKPEYYIPLLDSIICKSKKSEKIQLLIGDTGIGLNNRLYLNAYLKKFHESSKIIEFKYHFSKNNNLLEKYAYYENLLFCINTRQLALSIFRYYIRLYF